MLQTVNRPVLYKFEKTGQFLKSFVATSVAYFHNIMLFCKRTWYLKVETGISILNLTTRGAKIDLKNRPVFPNL